MDDDSNNKVLLWWVGIVGALLALLMVLVGPINDPALPLVLYDKDGVPYTQDGERIEEDHPLWDCETMGNGDCGDGAPVEP